MDITSKTEAVSSISSSEIQRTQPPDRPNNLPFLATPENNPKLEEYILNKFSSSAFNKSALFPASPIPVPHHWKAEIKTALDRDVERGIITPTPVGMPVEWCSPMVILKKTGLQDVL